MITRKNLKAFLRHIEFFEKGDEFTKLFPAIDAYLKVDFARQQLIYPEEKGLIVNERQTCNFSANENFVVFETVHRLFEKGYKPEHIELEPKWKLGRGASGGRADILVKDFKGASLLIIECKTPGKELVKAWKQMMVDGGQLFSYAQQERTTKFLCLYASDFDGSELTYEHYIITLVDNNRLLEEKQAISPLAYRNAKSVEDLFKAWKETYAQDYVTVGIFEDDIPAYKIGKSKYTLKDLKPVAQKDIQPKYHEFATILRQHNVSGRENAFDKLVNLFLCKIVDEIQNPADLQFYWKGIAYDSFFDLIDRLQRLYRDGMKQFLKEDVTYIDNQTIQDAFKFFKNDPDATRDKILDYFRQQKYFTNNDFALIDVHNENLFYQNAAVLLKIVQMLQGLRLTGNSSHNQFLGDMFEFFLDQGFKQTEGQFFTPLPVARFILMSLPLPSIIADAPETPKAIDYACGAGHFLTELALQARPFVEDIGKNPHHFYANLYGTEKEYRLSKVAKVSAFMYGQGEINVMYADALVQHPQIKEGDFKILVSNPPYSVRGFLETLPSSQRQHYELIATVDEKSYPTNNSIESFFIERAKQLLAPGGVAAIIAPTSVLSNADRTYTRTREILLRFFDIVALVEFPGGTFGKTGTNTVTLFLRRKDDNPPPSAHYRNRVNAWFKNNRSKDAVFLDEHLLRAYCVHIGIDFDDYCTLLDGKPNSALSDADIFKAYRQDFENSAEIRNLKKKKSFKEKPPAKQQAELNKRFQTYLRAIEKDKMYYFLLAYTQPNPVVIVRGPDKTKERKEFLGYEWSSRKGDEGIKLFTDANGKHITPLYDPDARNNPEKISYYIQQNFIGSNPPLPEALEAYVSFTRLVDLLDFGRVKFDKQISTALKRITTIQTRWELRPLGSTDVADVIPGQSPASEFYNDEGQGLPFYQGKKDFGEICLKSPTVWTTQITKESVRNDVLISVRAPVGSVNINPFDKICIGRGLAAIRCKKGVLHRYLFEFIAQNQDLFRGSQGMAFDSISANDLRAIKIPVPPMDVQQQIVAECQAIDDEVSQAEREIEHNQQSIKSLVNRTFTGKREHLTKLVYINRFSTDPTKKPNKIFTYVDIDSVDKKTGEINWSQRVSGKTAPSRARRIAPKGSVIISTVRPNLKGFAFIDRDTDDCVFSTGFAILESKNRKVILNKALYLAFRWLDDLMTQIESTMGKAAYPSINVSDIEKYTLLVPSLSDQKQLVETVEQMELEIRKARAVITSAESRKRAVLEKYL